MNKDPLAANELKIRIGIEPTTVKKVSSGQPPISYRSIAAAETVVRLFSVRNFFSCYFYFYPVVVKSLPTPSFASNTTINEAQQ